MGNPRQRAKDNGQRANKNRRPQTYEFIGRNGPITERTLNDLCFLPAAGVGRGKPPHHHLGVSRSREKGDEKGKVLSFVLFPLSFYFVSYAGYTKEMSDYG